MQDLNDKFLLDTGCGNNLIEKKGFRTIGIDLKTDTKASVVCNLEYFLPFQSNIFDEIYCYNVLEHVSNIIRLLEELYRVGKPKCIIKIEVPHFSGMDTHQDITHKRGFGSRSFYQFTGKDVKCAHYGECKFTLIKRKILFWEIVELGGIRIQELFGLGILANKFTSIYERFLCYIFPAQKIYFELKIDK